MEAKEAEKPNNPEGPTKRPRGRPRKAGIIAPDFTKRTLMIPVGPVHKEHGDSLNLVKDLPGLKESLKRNKFMKTKIADEYGLHFRVIQQMLAGSYCGGQLTPERRVAMETLQRVWFESLCEVLDKDEEAWSEIWFEEALDEGKVAEKVGVHWIVFREILARRDGRFPEEIAQAILAGRDVAAGRRQGKVKGLFIKAASGDVEDPHHVRAANIKAIELGGIQPDGTILNRRAAEGDTIVDARTINFNVLRGSGELRGIIGQVLGQSQEAAGVLEVKPEKKGEDSEKRPELPALATLYGEERVK